MGFSPAGLIIALAVFAPNLLLIKYPPKNVPADTKETPLIFMILERAGQAGSFIILAVSGDSFAGEPEIWCALTVLFTVLYYLLWLRYIIKGQEYAMLYEPVLGVPIPMAVTPVCALGCAAFWGRSSALGAAVMVFAIGFFINSWNNRIRPKHP